MKNIPHWPWLIVLYFFLVAIPVYSIHIALKKRALANRTFSNLLMYVSGVLISAFLLHLFVMWLYFTFFFRVSN